VPLRERATGGVLNRQTYHCIPSVSKDLAHKRPAPRRWAKSKPVPELNIRLCIQPRRATVFVRGPVGCAWTAPVPHPAIRLFWARWPSCALVFLFLSPISRCDHLPSKQSALWGGILCRPRISVFIFPAWKAAVHLTRIRLSGDQSRSLIACGSGYRAVQRGILLLFVHSFLYITRGWVG